jgi:hypothetical protein
MKNEKANSEYQKILKSLIIKEAKALKDAGYSEKQIKEIFDNKFVRSVGERARSLFDRSRNRTSQKSKELDPGFSKTSVTVPELIDLILTDPVVPTYIKNFAALLDNGAEMTPDEDQEDLASGLDGEDEFEAPVEDPGEFDMDMQSAVDKTTPAAPASAPEKPRKPKNPNRPKEKQPKERRAQTASDTYTPRFDAKSGKRSNRPQPPKEKKPSPNKKSSRKASLKEAILDRLSEKDRNDPKVQKLIEAIEQQMKKKM